MGKPTDLNSVGMEKGKFAALLGDAHEHIVIGILIRLGIEVGKVDVSSGPYDLFIYAYSRPKGERIFLRAQVKTIGTQGSIHLGGGSRGGIDREYKAGVKTYTYTTDHNDVIIGIDEHTLDLYVLPTVISQVKFKSTVSKSRLQLFKNNWDILLNWNTNYLEELEKKF